MKRKWVGFLSQELTAIGDAANGIRPTFEQGQKVIARKKKVFEKSVIDGKYYWDGKWEYHYSDENDTNLVRDSRFLIKKAESK